MLSAREWKPGDAAIWPFIVTSADRRGASTEPRRRWIRDGRRDGLDGARRTRLDMDGRVTDARPLVVIDPDDRAQVERLCGAYGHTISEGKALDGSTVETSLGR